MCLIFVLQKKKWNQFKAKKNEKGKIQASVHPEPHKLLTICVQLLCEVLWSEVTMALTLNLNGQDER